MKRLSKKVGLALILVLLAVLGFSLSILASDEACITCHTSPETMDALVTVVTKTSSGG